ncbi:MAG: hypothetical protein JWO28_2338 [Hyphomicrobiales bacterium]|jgi:hypothetical protein|nr:hypothetical protein [Hyphomicrobiales bacterium]
MRCDGAHLYRIAAWLDQIAATRHNHATGPQGRE